MRDELLEVMKLQREYAHTSTPAMRRRGELIGRRIRERLEFGCGSIEISSRPTRNRLSGSWAGRDRPKVVHAMGPVLFRRVGRPAPKKVGTAFISLMPRATPCTWILRHGSTTLTEGRIRTRDLRKS